MLEGLPWDREVQQGPTRQIWNRGDVLSDMETKSKMERLGLGRSRDCPAHHSEALARAQMSPQKRATGR